MSLWPEGFLAGERLTALVAVALIAGAYAWLAASRRTFAVRFTTLELLDTVAPRRPGWRRHASAVLFCLALTALVLTWARPTDDVRVPRERATVVLAIDTSLSMEATDVAPSRLEAAREAAVRFVDELPEPINLGLVTFDGVARVKVTPTTDRAPVLAAIDALELGPATAIGEAIFAGLEAIATAPVVDVDGEEVPATLVVMTDGKTTVGRPDADAIDAAVAAGVPVSTIAFGTDRGTVFIDGAVQPVPVERAALEEIAGDTGGRSFAAESLDELRSVYDDIGSSIGYDTEEREATERFAGLAVVALLLSAVASLLWSPRLP